MAAVLDDWRTAPISDQVKAVLPLLERLTLKPRDVAVADVAIARQAGVSDSAIRDAIQVCFLFNTIDRLADSFGFALPGEESHAQAAKMLLKRGYRMPAFLSRG